ncbi:MAG: hypothetical protein ACPL1B_09150 [Thermoprotei archaeon]
MITKDLLKDYYSSLTGSTGGTISSTQIPTTELSAAASAGATSITVYDAAPFAVNNEIVIDDGTNRERKIIAGISGNTITLNSGLAYSYAVNTPVATKNNLFPDVTAAQAQNGVTIYKKFFRKNTSTTETWFNVVNFILKQPTNSALSIGIGINDANDNDYNQGNMVAMSANAQIALVSSGTDTRTVTLVGLNTSGNPLTETVTLNGTTEVLSTNTFSKLYFAKASATDTANTITIKQGSGGTTIGTIGPNKIISFLWFGKKVDNTQNIVNAEGGDISNYSTGINLGDITYGNSIGFWCRLMVPAGASAVGNNTTFVVSQGETA